MGINSTDIKILQRCVSGLQGILESVRQLTFQIYFSSVVAVMDVAFIFYFPLHGLAIGVCATHLFSFFAWFRHQKRFFSLLFSILFTLVESPSVLLCLTFVALSIEFWVVWLEFPSLADLQCSCCFLKRGNLCCEFNDLLFLLWLVLFLLNYPLACFFSCSSFMCCSQRGI